MWGFLAGLVVTITTSALTAGSRADDAQTRKDAAEENAKLALANAQKVKSLTTADVGTLQIQGKRDLSNQRAALGFSGVDIKKGSALDIRNESTANLAKKIQDRQTQGDIDYNAFMADYANYKAAADVEDTDWFDNFLSGL